MSLEHDVWLYAASMKQRQWAMASGGLGAQVFIFPSTILGKLSLNLSILGATVPPPPLFSSL
jgi:hypothetical protein